MIDSKILKFGYGDIIVTGNCVLQQLSFQQNKTPCEIGEEDDEKLEGIGEKVCFTITRDDYIELLNNLNKVNLHEISEFTFRDYVFDFSNYNKKSVGVCKRQLNYATYCYFSSLAC